VAAGILEEFDMASSAQELAPSPSIFDDILSPICAEEFIAKYFGRSFLHLPGPRLKFSDLLPWNELNRILEEHRLFPPRLKLFQAGKEIESDKYIHQSGGPEPRLKHAELTNLLGQGATLIIDEFDELYRPIRELAASLERIFRIHIQVNLYAGWRTDQGFLLHYDKHDTLILQVAGRKHWQVYRPTRLYPLEHGKDAEQAEKPGGEPIWDDTLQAGGLLYIPRGWWHVAYPLEEPTLHLTFGLSNPRGIDLLSWFVSQLKNCEEVRKDIPHLSSATLQRAYLDKLREHLSSAWSPDLIHRYMQAADSRALPRPFFDLPDSATAEGIVVSRKSNVRLTAPRTLVVTAPAEQGHIRFKCVGKTLQCSVGILPALQSLNDGQVHAVQELIALTQGEDANTINFLQVLALQGILTVQSSGHNNFEPIRNGEPNERS
jgi:ribosomal protein L16 Arg81 hydroxylase